MPRNITYLIVSTVDQDLETNESYILHFGGIYCNHLQNKWVVFMCISFYIINYVKVKLNDWYIKSQLLRKEDLREDIFLVNAKLFDS
ncbi:hypothetical protein Dfri01_31160 [Dyadobacter frigoris]|nr:hypothetical protein Dfri01_31160 [Dyadobacter frigoris]